jgi:serine/threonine protein kinase
MVHTQRCRYIPEPKAVFFFRQIISGIDYLHKNSITHRDIKPANIILDAKQQVPKLIDFGFTNIFDEVSEITCLLHFL